MSAIDNILLHKALIAKARQLPVASTQRITLISRSIQGIVRARLESYNPEHFEG
jgi:hypothetical protein